MTNYLITITIHQANSEEIGDALIENIITKYCTPDYIIMDQDSTFMSSLMNCLFHKFDIKIKTVALYNHQSLQAKHCYVRQCGFICALLLDLSRGSASGILLFIMCTTIHNCLSSGSLVFAHLGRMSER